MSIDSAFTTGSLTWEEALREFLLHLKATRAPMTERFYRVQLRQLVHWADENKIPFQGFGKRHLDRYLAYRADSGSSPSTMRHDAVCTKAFMKWCARNELIERNLLADYEIRRAPARYMPTEENVRGLLAAIQNYWNPVKNPQARFVAPAKRIFHRDRNHALILGLLDSACRIGEMLNLKVEDFQESERMIYIRHSKGREPRALPISPEWTEALRVWLRVRARVMKGVESGADEGWLFISETGAQIDDARFRKTLKSYIQWAELPDSITLHSLRRFSLNRLAKTNLLAAQAIAGHKEAKTTLLYTKLDPDFVRDIHRNAGVVRSVTTAKDIVVRRKRLL